MNKTHLSFYVLMMFINILPFLPMSLKGILGLAFIIISSVQFEFKHGFLTATLWIVFGFINYNFDINVDYKYGIAAMLMGSLLYYLTAYYLGTSTKNLKNSNSELKNEIERRKKTEKELKEKLTLLQSLMDTIPSPIYFKDLEFRYLGCNCAFENSLGISNRDLNGKSVYDISDRELADIFNKMDIELLANKGKQVYETVARFNDGSLRNVIFNKSLFNDEMGNPLGIVGVMTDITDKKESEKLKQSIVENKRIIDEILEYNNLKTEFFSNISHELRTPLNVILGSVQLMELYSKDNLYNISRDKVIRNIAKMKQNCYRLLRLVNNLIDITKIDANAFEIHLKNCNIVSIVEEITLSVSDYIENKGIKLVFDTDIEEKIIACDDEKLERIMLNLLSNAVKFTPIGGSIFVNVYDKGDSVCIKVSDNGIGIPTDKQDQIFERFCQINGMFTRQHEGSGVGLNLVKSLVELHRGTITVESEFEKGSTFIINLPVRTVSEEVMECGTRVKQAQVERISVEFSDIYFIN